MMFSLKTEGSNLLYPFSRFARAKVGFELREHPRVIQSLVAAGARTGPWRSGAPVVFVGVCTLEKGS